MTRTLTTICDEILAGYAAEKSGMDDDMIPLLQELADRAEEIKALDTAQRAPLVQNATRCGYCGQDMIPGSECRTSTSASQCAMYQRYAATVQIDAPGVTASEKPKGGV